MTYSLIISTQDLAQHYNPVNWVIVDCRTELAEPESGRLDYLTAHIPGAVFADLNLDLAAPKTPQTGRHPLPTPEAVLRTFSRLGIDAQKQVVVYDAGGGAFADRLWWLLRYYGHNAVAVLDGGFTLWKTENRPVRSGEEENTPTTFTGLPNDSMIADAAEVERVRQMPGYLVIDARAPERFRGEVEPIDPIAGRIPNAVNRPHAANLTAGGVFKSPQTLRAEFERLLGDVDPQNTIVYCGSGITSIHHLLAMEIAGLTPGRLYPGSWSDWITDPARPIATGEE